MSESNYVTRPIPSSDRSMKDKNLLVISHGYNYFTKGQIDQIAKSFNEVHIYVRYNRLTDLRYVINSEYLEKYGSDVKISDESPDNVHVNSTPITYLPIDFWYKNLGKQHYRAVSKQIESNSIEFDIVHSHFTWTAGFVGARLAKEYDIPSILTIHENQDLLSEELSWENPDLKWTLRNSTAIIRVNETDCEILSDFNDNVYAIPNGYDRGRFPLLEVEEARNELNIPLDAKVIFSLGALIPRKRFDVLIESIQRLNYNGELICAIGGQGECRDKLEKIAPEYKNNDIRILGYLSQEELSYWMNACDMFALASESEGNPTVMFEALGVGKPYIGTNVGGVDEVISSNDYGLYCPPNSVPNFSNILKRAVKKEWDRKKIIEYSENYTWESIADEIIGVYDIHL